MQPNLGCSFADLKFFGDFSVAHAMHVAEDNYVAQTLGQIVERSAQSRSYRAVLQCEFGIVCFSVISEVDDPIDVVVARVTLAAAHKCRCGIRRDAMQPRGESSVAAKLLQTAKRPHVGVLNDIVGVVLIARQTKRKTVDLLIGRLDQFIECGPVALFGLRDQVFEVVFHNNPTLSDLLEFL